ncbi:MAG: hypothetical protein ACE5OS_00295 [Anaerolineae bacterium]
MTDLLDHSLNRLGREPLPAGFAASVMEAVALHRRRQARLRTLFAVACGLAGLASLPWTLAPLAEWLATLERALTADAWLWALVSGDTAAWMAVLDGLLILPDGLGVLAVATVTLLGMAGALALARLLPEERRALLPALPGGMG